jgi:hypothetical protein
MPGKDMEHVINIFDYFLYPSSTHTTLIIQRSAWRQQRLGSLPLSTEAHSVQFLIIQLGNFINLFGGLCWTVPGLFFEKKQLIPALRQLLVSCSQHWMYDV